MPTPAERMLRRRERHLRLGMCQDCCKPAAPDRHFCDTHLLRNRLRMQEEYEWRKTNHVCIRCGVPIEAATGTLCRACANKHARRQRLLAAACTLVCILLPAGYAHAGNVYVVVSPRSATLQSGHQQQFNASVSGAFNKNVNWSASCGTVTTTGLYTAPSVADASSCAVVATSQRDPSAQGSAAVTVDPASSQHFISLSWTASTSPNLIGYNVYRGTVSGGPYTRIASQVASTSYDDASVQNGSTYYYVTTAVDNTGAESTYSNEAQANLASSQHFASLSWTVSTSPNVIGYNVYRGTTSGGPYGRIASQVAGTSYDDASVEVGLTYYYVTTAVDNTGAESTYSNQAEAIIPSQ